MRLFKAIVTDHFGPFCGQGGYGTMRGVGLSKSPKQAVKRAFQNMKGNEGGGVPILCIRELTKPNGETVYLRGSD